MTCKLKKNLSTFLNETNHDNISHFYYNSYIYNIYDNKMTDKHLKIFINGYGGVIYSKACAVHSSSMLAYNFFSWIDKENTLEFNGIIYNHVEFEHKLKTLNSIIAMANIDIVLTSEDENTKLFIESKFLEYMDYKQFDISDKYSDPNNNTAKIDWSKLIGLYKGKKSNYYPGIKQNICHLVSISNYHKENQDKQITTLFMNLVFDPNKNEYEKEYKKYNNYKVLLDDFSKNYKNNVEGKLVDKVLFCSYSEIWKQMKPSIKDKNRIKYLKDRYIAFTNYPNVP